MTCESLAARPNADEYAPYYERYVSKVPPGAVVDALRAQQVTLESRLRGLTPAQAGYAYAPGKWTVKELIGHLIDAERVFAFRAVAFARGDGHALPPYDQDVWNLPARWNDRELAGLIEEWTAVRTATIAFFAGLPPDAFTRRGIASDVVFSVRALAWIIVGHVAYHVDVLNERYL